MSEKRDRYAQLSVLLHEWAAEPGDFDSRVGPTIEQALSSHRGRAEMSEQKWTPEPWDNNTVRQVPAGVRANTCDVAFRPLSEDNWQRAKACVNACVGIEKPIQFRQQRDEAVKALREYGRHPPVCRGHRYAQECDCGLSAAIARIGAEQKCRA